MRRWQFHPELGHRIEVFALLENRFQQTARHQPADPRSTESGPVAARPVETATCHPGNCQGAAAPRLDPSADSKFHRSAASVAAARKSKTDTSGQESGTSAKANRPTADDRKAISWQGDAGTELQTPTKAGAAVDTLAVSAMIMLAVTVIQRGVGFSRGILFCRWLDPAALGQWELAFSFVLLAAPLSVLGLPGSFGRYVAYYQRRGQLRMFLRRTAAWTGLLGMLAVATIVLAAPQVSWLVFGDTGHEGLVLVMGLCLATVILHHFLESLLAALRMFRAVSMVQFCQSLGFATIGLSLILLYRADAWSIVVAYGSACLLASTTAMLWIRSALHSVHDTAPAPAAASFWQKLLRFSIWVWIVNLLANLFVVVDRYMIIHYSNLTASEAISEVGQYHSSRIVPVLLVSIAELIGSMIMPYLSHDWEDGRQRRVSKTLNLAVKLVAFGMLVASWIILLAAPLLFGVAFAGKYAGGERILPWTLAYSSLFGIAVVAQNYLWCAEKARLCSVPMLIGLVSNIGLNMVLLPPLGLLGAVLATTVANLVMLLLAMWLVGKAGMEMDRGTSILVVLPLVIGVGPWATGLALLGVVAGVLGTNVLLTDQEKRRLIVVAARGIRWAKRRVPHAAR